MTPEELRQWIAWMPKVELHRHLEGSVTPEDLKILAARHHYPWHTDTEEQIAERYQYDNFRKFIECYIWVAAHFQTPADYAIVAARVAQRLAEQNVRYVELLVSAGIMVKQGVAVRPRLDAIRQAFDSIPGAPVMRIILDATRQFGPAPALNVAREAVACRDLGVVALGIGGDEIGGPAKWFREVFSWARRKGLRLHAHAGEWSGAQSVADALDAGAERIGHGLRAREDIKLLWRLAKEGVGVECCPSSNLCTGVIKSIGDHPLKDFMDREIPVSIATDDPPLFHTELSRELELAVTELGLTPMDLITLQQNAIDTSFAEDELKSRLRHDLMTNSRPANDPG